MASIYKRKNADGTSVWRAVIRLKGFPSISNHFERKQEAIDWGADTERRIKLGQYNFETHKIAYTYADLLDRLSGDGVLEHQHSLKKVQAQYDYWRTRLGAYALIHITPELISKERQHLKETKPLASTINRYMVTLSSTFSYAVKQLRWLAESPCLNLIKLKEAPGRDRILTDAEVTALLVACKESKSPYLYPIVLFALTTGARRGELLGLEWRSVDFDNRLASLKETKNGHPRSVALADPVIIELKALHAVRHPLKPLVFASKTAFGQVDIKKAWIQALKRAGIEDYHFHDMRHQFATLAAAHGASNLELAAAMGHRTLGMLQRYTHLDVQVTKKYSRHISERILQGDSQ
ncbi:MAG: site-specific integrase [Simkaniaceae bacterium]|nr:site-specific integrase [Simkaniaceae bacterium]